MGDEYVSVEHLFLCHDQVSESGNEESVQGVRHHQRDRFYRHCPPYGAIRG